MEIQPIYSQATLHRTIMVSINHIGANIKSTLEKRISKQLEGKCNVEGFIKKESCRIVSYSSGVLKNAYVSFDVAFDCLVCCPVEGMVIKCQVENITKAGIKAVIPGGYSPMIIFIIRDHHHLMKEFSTIKEEDTIQVNITGQRYELNDPYISVIGDYLPNKKAGAKAPRLIFKDNV